MYQELDGFTNPELAEIQIPVPCPTPVTQWLPRKEQPSPPPPGFQPTALEDILPEQGVKLMEQWLLEQLLYLADIEAHGVKATRKSDKPLALGADDYVQTRGTWYCLGSSSHG